MKLILLLLACCFAMNITLSVKKLEQSDRNYTVFVEDLDRKSYIDVFSDVNEFKTNFDIQTRVKVVWYSMDRFVYPEMLLMWIATERWRHQTYLNDFALFSAHYNEEKMNGFNFVINTNRKLFDGGILMNNDK